MATSLRTHHFCSSLSKARTRNSSIPSQPIKTQLPPGNWRSPEWWNRRSVTAMKCVKGGPVPVPELERKWEEMEEEEGEEWMGIWGEKCKGRGIVELMECLETEAIMGEDEGREPSDYNRRARIFDKSSQVFQALKDRDTSL